MDRGWRRCGDYYYKANLETSCCKPFSIRLDVGKYQIRRSHQKVMNRFNKFLNKEITLEELNKKYDKKPKNPDTMDEEVKVNDQKGHQIGAVQSQDSMHKAEVASISEALIVTTRSIVNELGQILQLADGQLEISPELEKKFKVSQPKKNEATYSTNFLNLVYSDNRKKFPELKFPDFISAIKGKVLDTYKPIVPPEYKIDVMDNGYVNFQSTIRIEEEKPPKKVDTRPKTRKEGAPENEKNNKEETIKLEPANGSKDKIEEETKQQKGDIQTQKPGQNKIKFEIKLAKAKCDNETFKMYKDYCQDVHEKSKEDKESYERFLCLQALEYQEIDSADKSRKLKLGCYHMKYYFDGVLIAIGVIDFTPIAMSSVYFFYDPKYKALTLGVVGAVKEIQFVQDLQQKFPDFKYYYLGFYIQDCRKMVYKRDYEPPELLCPYTYHWVVLDEKLREHIEKNHEDVRISKFLQKSPECIEDMNFSGVNLENYVKKYVKMTTQGQLISIMQLGKGGQIYLFKAFKDLCPGLGKKLSTEFVFALPN